ncbi:MAG: hypothetical protein ACRDIL_22065, partial [Candidatus Limnocylindrales bacterium]
RELLAILALQGGPFEGGRVHAHRGLAPHFREDRGGDRGDRRVGAGRAEVDLARRKEPLR